MNSAYDVIFVSKILCSVIIYVVLTIPWHFLTSKFIKNRHCRRRSLWWPFWKPTTPSERESLACPVIEILAVDNLPCSDSLYGVNPHTRPKCELIWLKQLIRELQFEEARPMSFICDSQGTLHIASNLVGGCF